MERGIWANDHRKYKTCVCSLTILASICVYISYSVLCSVQFVKLIRCFRCKSGLLADLKLYSLAGLLVVLLNHSDLVEFEGSMSQPSSLKGL